MKVVSWFMKLLIVVMLFCGSHQLVKKMGPYDIIVEQIVNCIPPEDGKVQFEVQPYFVKDESSGGRKQLFKGSVYSPLTKEEFYKLEIENKFYQRKTNDYLLMYTYRGNMCSSIASTIPQVYKAFLDELGSEGDDCFVQGNFSLVDWDPSVSFPTPMLEYGEFKVIMKPSLDGVVVACCEGYAEVKPKSETPPIL